jgi:hypothetical protein
MGQSLKNIIKNIALKFNGMVKHHSKHDEKEELILSVY